MILVIALLIFGPKAIPQIGKAIGSGLREFKEGLNGKRQDPSEESSKEADDSNKIDKA